MPRSILRSVLRFEVVVLALGACFVTQSPSSPARGLAVTLRMDRTQLAPGDVVNFHIIVRNPSSQTAVVHGSSSCIVGLEVRGAGGEIVAPRQRACTRDLREYRIGPGEEMIRTIPWNGTVDFSNGARLPSGEYRVNAVLDANEVRLLSDARSIFITAS